LGFGFLGEDFPDFTFVLMTWACLRAFVALSAGLADLPPVLCSAAYNKLFLPAKIGLTFADCLGALSPLLESGISAT
jgi:hypothetical protein